MRALRRRPTRGETLRAAVISAGLAAGVGLASFYLTRLLLAREPLAGRDAAPVDPRRSPPTSSEDREG